MVPFREIQRLRGLAIVLALFNHEPIHRLVPWFTGVVGVHLFFVISGFVITLSLLGLEQSSPHPLRTFYTRRFFRLFPMALVSIALALAAASWWNFGGLWHSKELVARQAAAALTLNYNYRTEELGWDLIYFWSLNVEEHFYLLLPLALLIGNRRLGPRGLLAATGLLWGAATATRLLTSPEIFSLKLFWQNHYSTHARLDALLAGVLLALVHHFRIFERPSTSREMRVAGRIVAAAAVVGITCVHLVGSWYSDWTWSFVELCAVTLVALASLRRHYVLQAPGLSPALEWLGARAYTIYLLHMGLWRVLAQTLGIPPLAGHTFTGLPLFALYGVVVLLVAELAYRFIERPLTDLGRRLSARTETASAPRAPAEAA